MLKSLRTTYPNASSSIARTGIVIVALISFLGFHHGTSSRDKSDQDGPVGVKYDRVFQTGDVKIEPLNLSDLPPLPAGYVALNNKAYRITTSAIVAGRHTVRFAVPSVTEEDIFQKLRIFRVDNDPFDPDGHVWVDVTLLKSSTAPPSFSTKTIYGQSEGLGTYVIAKLIREVPLTAAIADLVVTTSGVADRIVDAASDIANSYRQTLTANVQRDITALHQPTQSQDGKDNTPPHQTNTDDHLKHIRQTIDGMALQNGAINVTAIEAGIAEGESAASESLAALL